MFVMATEHNVTRLTGCSADQAAWRRGVTAHSFHSYALNELDTVTSSTYVYVAECNVIIVHNKSFSRAACFVHTCMYQQVHG